MRVFARRHAVLLLGAALTSVQWAATGGAQMPT